MEVTIVTAHLSSNSGGLAFSVPGMARALDTLGDTRVSIVGVRDPRMPEGWRGWGERVHAVQQRGPLAFGWAPGMVDAILQTKPDVVDAQGLWMYPSMASLAAHRATGKPYVITPRGMLDPWALKTASMKKWLAMTLFESAHLRSAACLRVTSTLEGENCRKAGLRNQIAIIANGIEIPPPLPDDNPQRHALKRVLFLSRLHPKKGIDLLLEAWSAIQDAFPDWELVIAGPDEKQHEQDMRALQHRLRAERVAWAGEVRGEEKTRLYRSADIFVLPTRAENFGLVIAEALAHGLPVITTRRAPWDGLVDHRCGWWIEPTSAELIGAMRHALALPATERAAMGQRGAGWIERSYGWERIGRQLHAMYHWVLGRGSKPDFVTT